MNKHIFIINGSGGVGKDTFVEIISEKISTMNYSSVHKVKEMARVAGWNGEKDEVSRKFLSDLKLLTSKYCDMSFKSIHKEIEIFKVFTKYRYLFIHIREPKEIQKVKDSIVNIPCKTLLIKRENVSHITTNIADKNVFNYKYDITIDNNGTIDDLYKKADEFISKYQ